jgi:DNA-binding transcriptional LysR family regulator
MGSSLNIADIEAFAVVAEMRSIAKASAGLHLSQPAITRRLQNLENQLGVRLFDRDSRPMVLTPEGQEAYKHAKNVLASASELQTAVIPGKKLTGGFRLGFSTQFAERDHRRNAKSTDPVAVVAPKGFRFRRGEGLAELSKHPWIVNPPGCSGRAHRERTIIMLSMHDGQNIAREAQRVGAQGFVSKSAAGQVLLKAVDVVFHGQNFFPTLNT